MERTLYDKIWGWAFILAGTGLIVAGICALGYQCFTWLKSGIWPSINLRDVIDGPVHGKWLGLNEVLYWFGRQSAGIAGVLVGWLATRVGSEMAGLK